MWWLKLVDHLKREWTVLTTRVRQSTPSRSLKIKPRHAAALALVFLQAGCAVAKATYALNGRAGYEINCPTGVQDCYAKAGDLCRQQGYDVFRESEAGFSLLIACKPPVLPN